MVDNNSLFESRIVDIRSRFGEWGVEAIIIASSTNRRWLSGFTGSAGLLLITEDRALLGTDSRYWDQASVQAPGFELDQLGRDMKQEMPRFLASAKRERIGIETEHVTLRQFSELQQVDGIEWIQLINPVSPLRWTKRESEVDKIRSAAAITDDAMNQVHTLLQPGMSERELAWKLEATMRNAGADSMAFPIIVAAGPNGAMAHHEPSNRSIQKGDVVIIDMGAKLKGYNSDLTRTFYVGDGEDSLFREVFGIVERAHDAAIAGLKGGVTGQSIDSLARDIIADAGYGKEFGHGLGHGIGLDVHEGPRLSRLSVDDILPGGTTVTVEPGIYISGWGGVRIEDLVLVTDNGYEVLSNCPKNPVIV
jgi:Xaa-Pro aminopeptidase